jgi:putative addiction module CopG family antidote
MQLTLSHSMQAFVDEQVRSGTFGSAEDVLRAGVAVLMQQTRIEELDPESLEAIYPGMRLKIKAGLEQARRGETTDGEAFFEGLEREGS